jgi:RNA polymerase sigma-70 factor (ECF subfamily)
MATLAAEGLRSMTHTATHDAAADRRRLYAGLVADHAEGVARFLYGMVGHRQTAEDLAQETYLRAWTGLDSLREPDSARSWLFAIAANTARRHLRQAGRLGWLPLDALRPAAARMEPGDGLDETALALEQALGRLGAEDRAILLLVGERDLTLTEAASALGIAPEAAKKRWQRACARFKKVMDEP